MISIHIAYTIDTLIGIFVISIHTACTIDTLISIFVISIHTAYTIDTLVSIFVLAASVYAGLSVDREVCTGDAWSSFSGLVR